ncbi:MAG: amidohydrolase family protein [Methanolobus sp.]|uniref:amidohydrolase family protein n=1 Tax=Methanolobus sp. TaxID=1874737 RepID=UPI00272FA887|nr:amidohydrolase family protein [Methanolobus sp.]MDP2217529.1 amidohydrolase family protein [Methanolobus sp.]
MTTEQTVYGTIVYGPEMDIIEGCIVIRDGIIKEVSEEKNNSTNIIAPCFINAHTHIGDSVLKDPKLGECVDYHVKRDLNALVKPPDGLKHQVLNKAPYHELVEAMEHSIRDMIMTGTGAFADFREGGLQGVHALEEAVDGLGIECIKLGRPRNPSVNNDVLHREIEQVLGRAEGIGMSGANDVDLQILKQIRTYTKKEKKKFAIHAGENDRSDIQGALSLEPDMLIHLTKAQEGDLKEIADQDIPVVVCPRSNFITGAGMAPVREMLKTGIRVAVGTDNVMLNSVSMFSEMEILSKVFGLEDRQVFIMCTLMGAAVLGLNTSGSILEKNQAKVMILNGNSHNLAGVRNPISSIVRRGRPDDILSIII